MQNPLISVIVPIYNVEAYLDRCVKSILTQTYTNLEIFLVDDGSPDRCGEMCDEYARQDSRIKVIHKPNGGVSDARNAALDVSTGDYIACVDGDDTVSPDYIETMYSLTIKYGCELAMANFVFDYGGKRIYSKEKYKEITYTPIEAITELFYQGNFDDYPWCKLYHRSLFDGIRYPKGIIFEDTCVTYLIMHRCKKIAYCNKQVLNYMIRENSYEGAPFNELKMDSALAVFASLGQEHADIVSLVDKAYRCRMFTFACHLLLKMPQNYSKKHILWKKIVMYRRSVLFDNRANPKARLAALLSYLGINMMQLAFRLVDKRKKKQ